MPWTFYANDTPHSLIHQVSILKEPHRTTLKYWCRAPWAHDELLQKLGQAQYYEVNSRDCTVEVQGSDQSLFLNFLQLLPEISHQMYLKLRTELNIPQSTRPYRAVPVWVTSFDGQVHVYKNTGSRTFVREVRITRDASQGIVLQMLASNAMNFASLVEKLPQLTRSSGVIHRSVGNMVSLEASTQGVSALATYCIQLKDLLPDFTASFTEEVAMRIRNFTPEGLAEISSPSPSSRSLFSDIGYYDNDDDDDSSIEEMFVDTLNAIDSPASAGYANAILNSYQINHAPAPLVPTPPSVNAAKIEEHQWTKRVPKRFICGISGQIMDKPMYVPGIAGHYNEAHIKQWIELKKTHPHTRASMTLESFMHDTTMQSEINTFMIGVTGEGLRRSERLENKRQKLK